ncbi:hypothetical protein MIR68_002242 [Amoeboaphelidium protococcarum]|nr:hypothetical protein MIR68_002242 [Amoeboaphelidium protococcarum]
MVGVPSFALGTGAVVGLYPFNPTTPIVGIDPALMVMFGAIGAGIASYQLGGALSSSLWRWWNRRLVSQYDKMDKDFFGRIKTYRAERAQSPYLTTMEGTTNVLKSGLKNIKSGKDATTSERMAADYYGERVSSVSGYRQWLRQHHKWNKEHLGEQAAKIRGVKLNESQK